MTQETTEETIYSPIHFLEYTHWVIESDDLLIEIEAKSGAVDTKSEAYLVTARHDLLAACEWLVNLACGVSKDGGEPTSSEFADAVDAAKAAIAKARGETVDDD